MFVKVIAIALSLPRLMHKPLKLPLELRCGRDIRYRMLD